MNIKDEALKRYPVQLVNQSAGYPPCMEDVNEHKRRIFIEGAEFVSNEAESPECIIIRVQGIPLDRKESIKRELQNVLTQNLPLAYGR